MSEHDLPCTPILTVEEAIKNPQARSRQMILEKEPIGSSKFSYVGNPCKISDLGQVELTPSPKLGEHSAEILHEIGYSDSRIQTFVESGVI